MTSPNLVSNEAAIDQLPFSDQLRLIEHLAKRIRERSQHSPDKRGAELVEMASDPAIQRELREIAAEFAMTESDGLEALP